MTGPRAPDDGPVPRLGSSAYEALSASLVGTFANSDASATHANADAAVVFGNTLPASWYRAPPPPARPRRDLTRPAGLGAIAGLLCAAPALYYLRAGPAPLVDPATVGALIAPRAGDVSLSPYLTPADRMRAMLELARLRLVSGDVVGARTLLSRADAARDPEALFLLAETYDPSRIADWGGLSSLADRDIARALYVAADALGHGAAEMRLERLGAVMTFRASGHDKTEKTETRP